MESTNNVNIPLPYSAFTCMNQHLYHTVDRYQRALREYSESNRMKDRDGSDAVDFLMTFVDKNYVTKSIIDWLYSHSDKIQYYMDFSGFCFGLFVNEIDGTFHIRDISNESRDNLENYPQFDVYHYISLDVIGKLNWIYDNCEFIPVRLMHEDLMDGRSHRFSHIKKDDYTMGLLKGYLDESKYPPRDDVWYFIHYSSTSGGYYYLERDIIKSPRPKRRDEKHEN